MKLVPATTLMPEKEMPSSVQPDTKLHGRSLWVVRAAWTAVFLLVLSVVTVNLPHLVSDTRQQWQVGQALTAARSIFPSTEAFVSYLVFIKLVVVAVFVGTAVFLAWRRSDDWMVLFTSAALLLLIYLFGFGLNVDVIRYPDFLEQYLPITRMIFPILIVIALIGLFYIFPDGRFYPRWLVLVASSVVVLNAIVFYEAFHYTIDVDIPFLGFLPEEWGWWIYVTSLLVGLAIGLTSRIIYYHRLADETQRRQIKLVLFGLGAVIALPILQAILDALGLFSYSWGHFVALNLDALVPVVLPLTIGMSVLRYRLWDVDLLINRTLVYGFLTAVVLLLYGLAVGLAGAYLPGAANWFVPILGLALVIVAVKPLRDRLQQGADRLLPVQPDEGSTQVIQDPNSTWLLRFMQISWAALFLLLAWHVTLRLVDLDSLFSSMRREWIISEIARGIPTMPMADLARFVVFSELWNLGISWLLAGFVFLRRRQIWMGLFVAYLLLIMPFAVSFGTYGEPLVSGFAFISMGIMILFLFFFPDGRFVPLSRSGRGILVGSLFAVIPVTLALAQLLWPEADISEQGYFSFIFTTTAVMISGVGSQVYRYRRLADDVQRRQTRWVLVGLSLRVAWFVLAAVWLSLAPSISTFSQSLLALATVIFSLAASTALPLSIAVAIVYDRLWQMDLVLNRTLVFGGLTALVVILYVLVVGLLGSLFQSGNSLFLSILATGLIAVLFNPLRQRLQRGVNRLIYGQRDDPLTVMAELGKQLEDSAVPGETLPALAETIAQTLKLPYVAFMGNDQKIIAEAGVLREAPLSEYPLIYQTQAVGWLQVAARTNGEQFTKDEDRLLRNVARQAGTAVYAYQLTDQLQRSRERLVTTREEERRRLRRDLHDGLGPQLATLTVKVNAAENLLEADPQGAKKLLAEVRAESQSAIQEIRRVVEALRPSSLDQLGLLSALREFAGQNSNGSLTVTLAAPNKLPQLSAAVEVAAFRIVTEAVTNCVRHAQANYCHIILSVNEKLHLEIADDGLGLPAEMQPGIGLASMRERAVELGGQFEVQSIAEKGMKILVDLPLMDGQ